MLRPKHLILCISDENLPFIDSESPGCSHYNDRIIQMMPRNMLIASSTERQNMITSEWEKLHHMQKAFPTHKYIEIDVMDAQICQKCHKHLSFKKTYKCSLCDFICHQLCAADKVSFALALKSKFELVICVGSAIKRATTKRKRNNSSSSSFVTERETSLPHQNVRYLLSPRDSLSLIR